MTASFLDFEAKTDGAAVTTTGTGADLLSSTAGTMVWDDDLVIPAEFGVAGSILITPSSTASVNYLQRGTGINAANLSVCLGVNAAALTSSGGGSLIWVGKTDGTTRSFVVGLYPDGKAAIQDAGASGGAVIYTSTVAVPTGISRWEINATATTIRLRVYAGNSTTPTIDSGVLTGKNLGAANFGSIRYGKAATGTYANPFSIFYAGWDTTGAEIGLPVLAATPPTGSATVDHTPSDGLVTLTAAPGEAGTLTPSLTGPTGSPAPVLRGTVSNVTTWTVPRDATVAYQYTWEVVESPSGESASGTVTVDPVSATQTPVGMIEEIIFDGAWP